LVNNSGRRNIIGQHYGGDMNGVNYVEKSSKRDRERGGGGI
jgi:hypothetical protein